ncbi:uncharacterized protein LOC125598168 [Brassica napus]|uniref:uncharacterized protein LOC125598168 n=1 Tax=Brassica napus TaxID=3708 RepID=UPI0020790D3D|nr:uncharacterized protein LOC125598168 [Brassica napus]
MEAENGVTQEPSQPREADMEPENGFTQEPSQSREADMEPENGVTQEPSQPREADIETENGISGAEASPSDGKQKKKRGPTKMRKVAKDHQEKVSVSFTELGEHVGPGSVTLSSFLGPLVREHVTVLLDDWRNLDKQTKDTLWEEIQARFDLKEEWQKDSVFKQMGCLWRSGKSRLVSQLRNAKSSTERAALKPSNIRSVQVWSAWVKSRTSSVFKAKSEKYRALRRAQIPHTTSRRGMNRLACEMKKKSEDPKKISRSKVWIAGHTHSDGRPVRPEFAETIEKIISLDSQMDSTSSVNIKEDAVSQVLGVDKPGRVRGLGRGITATKLAFLSARDSKLADLESEIKDLKILVRDLAGNKKNNDDCVSPSEASYVYKEGTRVQLLDWCESKDVVVAEGEFCSAEGTYKIGRIPIGPNAAAVVVKSVSNPKASVWRPTTDVRNLQEAAGCKIPWPIDKLILDSASNNHPVSSDVLRSKNTTVDDLERCKIYDWVKGVEVIAEGFMGSTDPYEMVNNVPLGPNAVVMRVAKINGKLFYGGQQVT